MPLDRPTLSVAIRTGSLRDLAMRAQQLERHADLLDFLEHYLDDERPMIREIIDIVCEFYDVTPHALSSGRKFIHLVVPRQIAAYLSRELTLKSLNMIARKLGCKDHTTIWHAVNRIRYLMHWDEIMRDDVDFLKAKIAAKVYARHIMRGSHEPSAPGFRQPAADDDAANGAAGAGRADGDAHPYRGSTNPLCKHRIRPRPALRDFGQGG